MNILWYTIGALLNLLLYLKFVLTVSYSTNTKKGASTNKWLKLIDIWNFEIIWHAKNIDEYMLINSL